MPTDFRTAQLSLAQWLVTASITSPITTGINAYQLTQPDSIADWPTIILWGHSVRVTRATGMRKKVYTQRLRLLVKDANVDRTTDILEMLGDAMVSVMDQHITLGLGDGYRVVEGPNWEEPTQVVAGGVECGGMDGIIIVELSDPVDFAA